MALAGSVPELMRHAIAFRIVGLVYPKYVFYAVFMHFWVWEQNEKIVGFLFGLRGGLLIFASAFGVRLLA